MKRYTKYFTIALITLIAMANTAVAQSLYSYKPYGTWNSPYSWTTVSGGLQYQNEDLLYPAMNGATENLVTISENKSMTFNGSEDIYLKSLDVKGTLILEGEHSINVEKLTGKGEIQLTSFSQLKVKSGDTYNPINSFAGTITLAGTVNLDATGGNSYGFANIVVKSGVTTIKGKLNISNNLIVRGAGTLQYADAANNELVVGGDLILNTGGQISALGANENILNVKGNVINDGIIGGVHVDESSIVVNVTEEQIRSKYNLTKPTAPTPSFFDLSNRSGWSTTNNWKHDNLANIDEGAIIEINWSVVWSWDATANINLKVGDEVLFSKTQAPNSHGLKNEITVDARLASLLRTNKAIVNASGNLVTISGITIKNYVSKTLHDKYVDDLAIYNTELAAYRIIMEGEERQRLLEEAIRNAESSSCYITIQFSGNKDAAFRNNGTAKFYRVIGQKDKNRRVDIINSRESDNLKAIAPTFNVRDYKNLPWSVTSGILSLGDGVQIDAWGVPQLNTYYDHSIASYIAKNGAMYIPSGAVLEIAGAKVSVGEAGTDNNSRYRGAVLIAGTLRMKAGELNLPDYSPGIFFINASEYGEAKSTVQPQLSVDGGVINTTRIGVYKYQPAAFSMSDGEINFNKELKNPGDQYNKSLYLSTGSRFAMTGGVMTFTKTHTNWSKKDIRGIWLADDANADTDSYVPLTFNVSGGEIVIDGTGMGGNEFQIFGPGMSFPNLTINNNAKVAVNNLNTWPGYLDNRVSIIDMNIGNGCTLKVSKCRLLVSGNVTLGSNITLQTPDGSDHETLGAAYRRDLVFCGSKNVTYSDAAANGTRWKNVVLQKPAESKITVSGNGLFLNGNLTGDFGKMVGNVNMVGSSTQYISDNFCFKETILHIKNNVELASNAHFNNVVFDADNKMFSLLDYNLKLEAYPYRTAGAWDENSMFYTNNDDSAGGVSLPVPSSLSDNDAITLHIGTYGCPEQYTDKHYVYNEVRAMYTVPAGSAKYWTAIPVNDSHPVIKAKNNQGQNFDYYFIFKSDVTTKVDNAYYVAIKNYYEGDIRVCTADKKGVLTSIRVDGVTENCASYTSNGIKVPFFGTISSWFYLTCSTYPTSDFTICESGNGAGVGTSYITVGSGEWKDPIWRKSDDPTAAPISGTNGQITNYTNLIIDNEHTVYVTAKQGSNCLTAGKLTIKKGGKLEVNGSLIGNVSVKTLDGEGVLQYNIEASDNKTCLTGNVSQFYSNNVAKVIYNLNADIRVDKSGKWSGVDMPNLEIVSNGQHTFHWLLESGRRTVVHGGVTIGENVQVGFYAWDNGNLTITEDFTNNGTWTIASSKVQSNPSNGNQEVITLSGNLINNGTITKNFVKDNNAEEAIADIHLTDRTVKVNGDEVILGGNLTNNGTIDLKGCTVTVEGKSHSTYKGTATAKGKTNLGDLHLNKSMGSVGITAQLPLGDASGLALLKIDCGLFRHSYAGDMITYKGDDCFYIPGGSKFSVDKGTARIYVAEPTADKNDRVKLSGDLEVAKGATLDMLGGIGYTSGSALTVKGNVNASFLAPFGGDANIVYKEVSGANLTLGPSGNYKTYEDYGVFDIREGSNVSITGGAILISNTASNDDNITIFYHPSVSSIGINIGMTISTPEGKNCRIDATSALGWLKVNGGLDTRVLVENNPLTLGGYLYVASGKFYCCGNDLILKQFNKYSLWTTANGSFSVGDIDGNLKDVNTVTIMYVSETEHRMTLGNTVEFNNLVTNASLLTINRDIIVNGELRVANGVVKSSKIIRSHGDVYVNHGATISGGYLWMEGTENEQALVNEGEIANLVINNPLGVNASSQQANPITITKGLEFQRGSLRIGGNILDMKEGASIEKGGDSEFGPDMMIITNASFTDRGVRLYFAAGEERDMVVPLGDGNKYSPFVLRYVEALSAGNITVYANKGVHSSIKNSDPSKTNFLKYYWSVKATTGFRIASGSFFMNDDINDAVGLVAPGTCTLNPEDDCRYVTTVLNTNTGDFDIAGGTLDFIENGSKLQLTFRNLQAKDISGIYTAGCVKDLPTDGVTTYQTVADGNWSGQAIWQKYNRETSSFEGPAIEVPNKNGSKFIVKHNVTLHPSVDPLNPMDGDSYLNIFSLDIEEGGVVDLNGVENNNFGIVSGTGKLIVRSADMPGANYDSFFNVGGGTIEYSSKDVAITYPVFVGIPYHNNVIFSGKGKRQLPSTNTVSAYGNVAVEGEVEVELNGQDVYLYKDLDFSSTDATCTGDGSFIFRGTETQYLNIPKPMSLAGIGVNNELGVTINDDLTIGKLVLTSGYIKMDAEKTLAMNTAQSVVTIGSSSSYIDGWFARPLDATKYTTFPVGNLNRAASTDVYPYTSGVWRVRYSNRRIATEGSVLYNKIMSDLNNSIEGIDNEYWEVDGPGNARVRLRWDEQTNVVDISTLKVITQRDASSWKSISYSKGAVVDNTGVLLTASQTSRVSSAPRIFFFSTSAESASFEWWGYISTSWDEAGNWSKNEVPTLASDITVGPLTDGAYELVIDDDIDGRQANAKSIIIENGGKLTLQGNGTTLYVDKDLTIRTGGQLTLKYDVDANPNFFVKGTISGTTNVERSIKAGRKYYAGSATTERLITPGDGWDETYVYIRKYDHPNYKFVNPGKSGGKYYFDRHADYEGEVNSLAESLNTFGILSGTGAKGTVVAGNKYSFYQNGTVSNASKKYTLNAFQGSNWYSNPYPFALKMTKEVLRVTQPTTNDLVEKTIYTYESMNDDGVFEPRSYNLSTGVGVSDFVALAPFQGFEVLCQDRNKVFTRDAVKSQLQLSPVLYTGSAGEEYGIKLKSASLDDTVGKVLRVFAGNDLSTDELVLLFNEEGSMSMISGDSEKKANSAPAVLNQISTDKGGSSLVITHMPSVEELIGMGVTLPINLYKATNANDLSVWIKNIDEFNFTGNIYLVDNLAGVKFNLTLDGEYNCPEVDNLYSGRFELAFEPSEEEIVTPPTAIEVTNSDIERIRIWVESEEKARVTIFGNVEDNARAVVFDIMGREIISQSLTNRVSQIAMPSKGVYVVNVINGKSSKSEKLVL